MADDKLQICNDKSIAFLLRALCVSVVNFFVIEPDRVRFEAPPCAKL